MPPGSPSLLPKVLAHHQRGDLSLVSQLHRQINSADPANAEALDLLRVTSLQLGQPRQAVSSLEQAITPQPGASAFHSSLGEAYRALGQLERAEAGFRLALCLKPGNVDAAYNFSLLLMQQSQPTKILTNGRCAQPASYKRTSRFIAVPRLAGVIARAPCERSSPTRRDVLVRTHARAVRHAARSARLYPLG